MEIFSFVYLIPKAFQKHNVSFSSPELLLILFKVPFFKKLNSCLCS